MQNLIVNGCQYNVGELIVIKHKRNYNIYRIEDILDNSYTYTSFNMGNLLSGSTAHLRSRIVTNRLICREVMNHKGKRVYGRTRIVPEDFIQRDYVKKLDEYIIDREQQLISYKKMQLRNTCLQQQV